MRLSSASLYSTVVPLCMYLSIQYQLQYQLSWLLCTLSASVCTVTVVHCCYRTVPYTGCKSPFLKPFASLTSSRLYTLLPPRMLIEGRKSCRSEQIGSKEYSTSPVKEQAKKYVQYSILYVAWMPSFCGWRVSWAFRFTPSKEYKEYGARKSGSAGKKACRAGCTRHLSAGWL